MTRIARIACLPARQRIVSLLSKVSNAAKTRPVFSSRSKRVVVVSTSPRLPMSFSTIPGGIQRLRTRPLTGHTVLARQTRSSPTVFSCVTAWKRRSASYRNRKPRWSPVSWVRKASPGTSAAKTSPSSAAKPKNNKTAIWFSSSRRR